MSHMRKATPTLPDARSMTLGVAYILRGELERELDVQVLVFLTQFR